MFIHPHTPENMIPTQGEIKKFLDECYVDLEKTDCIHWGKKQPKHDIFKNTVIGTYTMPKKINMRFRIKKKQIHVKNLIFMWKYGFLPSKDKKIINICKKKTCVNGSHLSFSGFNPELLLSEFYNDNPKNVEEKEDDNNELINIKPIMHERLLESMKKDIHPNVPFQFIPDYNSYCRFLMSCRENWEGDKCITWKPQKFQFFLNGDYVNPKSLVYIWKYGMCIKKISKEYNLCKKKKCLNMKHLMAYPNQIQLNELTKKIKIENDNKI